MSDEPLAIITSSREALHDKCIRTDVPFETRVLCETILDCTEAICRALVMAVPGQGEIGEGVYSALKAARDL